MPYYPLYGSGTNQITSDGPQGSHDLQMWGAPNSVTLQAAGNIGPGAALTANQAYWINPFPYIYLYDIYVTVLTSGSASGHLVDLYNAYSGGSSVLSSSFAITSSITTPTAFSGRFANPAPYPAYYDPLLAQGGNFTLFQAKGIFPRGAVFSLRAFTPASSGVLNDLAMQIIFIPSNIPQIVP